MSIPQTTPHVGLEALSDTGVVELANHRHGFRESDVEPLHFFDWKAGGDTEFLVLASGDGTPDLRVYGNDGTPDKGAQWTAESSTLPEFRHYVEDIGSDFGRVRLMRLQSQDRESALRSLHRYDNNRNNPAGSGRVVRAYLIVSEQPESYHLTFESGPDGVPDPASERRVALHSGSRYVIDDQRLWNVIVHPSAQPLYALIASLESGPALERWIARNVRAPSLPEIPEGLEPATIAELVALERKGSLTTSEVQTLANAAEPILQQAERMLHDGLWSEDEALQLDAERAIETLRNELYPAVDRLPNPRMLDALCVRLSRYMVRGLADTPESPDAARNWLQEFDERVLAPLAHLELGDGQDGAYVADVADSIAERSDWTMAEPPEWLADQHEWDRFVLVAESRPRRTVATLLKWIGPAAAINRAMPVLSDGAQVGGVSGGLLGLAVGAAFNGVAGAGIGATVGGTAGGVLGAVVGYLAATLAESYHASPTDADPDDADE